MYKKFGLMLIISNYWKFLIFQKYIFDILKYANYHVYNKLNCNKIYNNVFYNFYCLLAKVYFIITKVHKVHKYTLLITYVYMGRNNIVCHTQLYTVALSMCIKHVVGLASRWQHFCPSDPSFPLPWLCAEIADSCWNRATILIFLRSVLYCLEYNCSLVILI